MKKVTLVGAGFSGMSLAFHLLKQGFQVEIFEKNSRSGGMIQTHHLHSGLVESAANGFLNTRELEDFLIEINADYIETSAQSKKRYLFRDKPQRWPLTIFESIKFILRFFFFLIRSLPQKKAHAHESVASWSKRNFGEEFTQFLLAPALQGIYAGDVNRLSASLIINRILGRRSSKKKSASALFSSSQGMGYLLSQLEKYLTEKGVKFYFNQPWTQQADFDFLVLNCSAADAADLLSQIQTEEAQFNSQILNQIEFLPLVTVTCFFENEPELYKGFGILFSAQSKIKALGVLMNNFIFDRQQKFHSETWILGGALNTHIVDLSDSEIKMMILENRKKVFNLNEEIVEFKLTRWPKALPHYTIDLEKNINMLKPMNQIFLHGNYLGNIGLSRILESSRELAKKIKEQSHSSL